MVSKGLRGRLRTWFPKQFLILVMCPIPPKIFYPLSPLKLETPCIYREIERQRQRFKYYKSEFFACSCRQFIFTIFYWLNVFDIIKSVLSIHHIYYNPNENSITRNSVHRLKCYQIILRFPVHSLICSVLIKTSRSIYVFYKCINTKSEVSFIN